MKKYFSYILLFLSICIFSVGLIYFVACSENASSSSGDDDTGPGQGAPGTISAYVRDFQTKTEVQGASVELVNDETGDLLGENYKQTSGSDGLVSFNNIPSDMEKIGVKVTKEGNKDTYEFHFNVGVTNEEFLLVSQSTVDFVSLGLGITIDPTLSVVAGGVYWWDSDNENPVGCAVVTVDPPAQHVYYFGPDALPTSARDISGSWPANGQGTNPGVDTKGHAISYFMSPNQPLGEGTVTISAKAGADTAGGEPPNLAQTGIPKLSANSVCISNVYYSKDIYPTNPTPSWCTQ